jgi:hypothetical protein
MVSTMIWEGITRIFIPRRSSGFMMGPFLVIMFRVPRRRNSREVMQMEGFEFLAQRFAQGTVEDREFMVLIAVNIGHSERD